MAISTQDCKDFIASISNIVGSSSLDDWKRIKKYKYESLVLRDFRNQEGRGLTIAEKDGQLFLYQLSSPETNVIGRTFLGRKAKEKDITYFIAQCVVNDNDILGSSFSLDSDNIQVLSTGQNPSSWTIWEKWNQTEDTLQDFLEEDNGQLDLYYADGNGETQKVRETDILEVFWVGMPDYDTAYRIYIFETKNHTLLLGCNEPD